MCARVRLSARVCVCVRVFDSFLHLCVRHGTVQSPATLKTHLVWLSITVFLCCCLPVSSLPHHWSAHQSTMANKGEIKPTETPTPTPIHTVKHTVYTHTRSNACMAQTHKQNRMCPQSVVNDSSLTQLNHFRLSH